MACHLSKTNSTTDYEILPPKCLSKPMFVRDKRLLGAGPSNPPAQVLNALSLPVMGHTHPETLQVCKIINCQSFHALAQINIFYLRSLKQQLLLFIIDYG